MAYDIPPLRVMVLHDRPLVEEPSYYLNNLLEIQEGLIATGEEMEVSVTYGEFTFGLYYKAIKFTPPPNCEHLTRNVWICTPHEAPYADLALLLPLRAQQTEKVSHEVVQVARNAMQLDGDLKHVRVSDKSVTYPSHWPFELFDMTIELHSESD